MSIYSRLTADRLRRSVLNGPLIGQLCLQVLTVWVAWMVLSPNRGWLTIGIFTVCIFANFLAMANLILMYLAATTLETDGSRLKWTGRSLFRRRESEFDTGELIAIASERSLFFGNKVVAISQARDRSILLVGSQDECMKVAEKLNSALGLELPAQVLPPRGARFTLYKFSSSIFVRLESRTRWGLLSAVFLAVYPTSAAVMHHLNRESDRELLGPILAVSLLIALVLVGIVHQLLGANSPRTHLILHSGGLFRIHEGRQWHTDEYDLAGISHFSVARDTLAAHLRRGNVQEPAPVLLARNLNAAEADFLCDQFTRTLSSLQ